MIADEQIFEFDAPNGRYYTVRRLSEFDAGTDLDSGHRQRSNGHIPDRDVVEWFPRGRGSKDPFGKIDLTDVEPGTVITTLFRANTDNVFAVVTKAVLDQDTGIQSDYSECGPDQPVPEGMLLALRAARNAWNAQL